MRTNKTKLMRAVKKAVRMTDTYKRAALLLNKTGVRTARGKRWTRTNLVMTIYRDKQ